MLNNVSKGCFGDAATQNLARSHNVDQFHSDQVAATHVAVDSKVEKRQITMVFGEFEPNPDGLDLLQLERSLLTNDLALFQSGTKRENGRKVCCVHD